MNAAHRLSVVLTLTVLSAGCADETASGGDPSDTAVAPEDTEIADGSDSAVTVEDTGTAPEVSVPVDAAADTFVPFVPSPYPVYTKAEVDAWSTKSPEYTRLAGSWAGNVGRTYASYGAEIDSTERDVLKDESVYIKTQAVLFAADGNMARKNKVVALLDDLRGVTSWQTDSVEQYRLVAGWAMTNLAQAAAFVDYHDPAFSKFLVSVCYPLLDWTGANNWQASFADSRLAIAVYEKNESLYADAKAYFQARIAQSNYHSKYDGMKVVPLLKADGKTPDISMTISTWGGYWGAPQVKSDLTFVDPSYVGDGFNSETIRDLGHVSMGLGGWMHAARTILAHEGVLDKQAYDRLHAAYALHGKRVIAFKKTGSPPPPATVKTEDKSSNGAFNQSWFGAHRLFGSDTPAEVGAMLADPQVTSFPAAGANHLVDEPFCDGP